MVYSVYLKLMNKITSNHIYCTKNFESVQTMFINCPAVFFKSLVAISIKPFENKNLMSIKNPYTIEDTLGTFSS